MGRLRELKIITFVPCPACGRRAGQPCRFTDTGRLSVHPERKAAWQADQAAHEPDIRLAPHHEGPVGQRVGYVLVASQSAEALVWLRAQADPAWEWIGGALRVPADDMHALLERIIRARWRTAGME